MTGDNTTISKTIRKGQPADPTEFLNAKVKILNAKVKILEELVDIYRELSGRQTRLLDMVEKAMSK